MTEQDIDDLRDYAVPNRENPPASLAHIGDHAGALEYCRRAVQLEPKKGAYQTALGDALRATGDLAGALVHLECAITDTLEGGDHVIHVGRIDRMKLLRCDSNDPGDFFEAAVELMPAEVEVIRLEMYGFDA